MRWKRMRISSFWALGLLLLFVFLLVGCGGGEDEDFSLPLLPEPTPFPFEGDGLYVGSEHRLVFPTSTLVPTSTPRPARVALSRKISTLAPTSTPAPSLAFAPLVDLPDGEVLSCVDHYRWMLIGYDGRIKFGPEVVDELSENMKEVRPDCVIEGWAPEFGLEAVCTSTRIAQTRVRDAFFRWEGNKEKRAIARATMRDDRGNIMVHFQRMPFHDGGGCWYYDSPNLSWAWLVFVESRLRSGIDRPQFPTCEKHLRNLLDEASLENFSALDVARLLDRVKLDAPSECGDLWDIYPQREARDDCEVSGSTGSVYDGSSVISLLINWHLEHPASDGSICWVRRVAGGEWELLHTVQVEEVVEDESPEADIPEVDLARAPDNLEAVEPSEDVSLPTPEAPASDVSGTPEALVSDVSETSEAPAPDVSETPTSDVSGAPGPAGGGG